VTTGTGFAVGFIRWLLKYPENLPGFFKEVNTCHVDPTWALPTAAISAISLAGGANLGPEQAMVSISSPSSPHADLREILVGVWQRSFATISTLKIMKRRTSLS
jgi:hypothetical protein